MIAGWFTLLWFFFPSILIFRIYLGLMGAHRIHSMGAAWSRMQNVNRDGQGRKGGKGAEQKFCLFASLEYIRGIEKDFLSKNPIAPSPTQLCPCTNKTNLFSTLPDFCFVTEELGGCDSKEMGAADSQIRRWFTLRPFQMLFFPEGALISPRLLLLVF